MPGMIANYQMSTCLLAFLANYDKKYFKRGPRYGERTHLALHSRTEGEMKVALDAGKGSGAKKKSSDIISIIL